MENATRMTNRRINEIIGLRYDDLDKIPEIVNKVRSYLEANKNIDQSNKPIVFFKAFHLHHVTFSYMLLQTPKTGGHTWKLERISYIKLRKLYPSMMLLLLFLQLLLTGNKIS